MPETQIEIVPETQIEIVPETQIEIVPETQIETQACRKNAYMRIRIHTSSPR